MEVPGFTQAKALILNNIKDGVLWVRSKRTGEEYAIARQYPTYDGWFVYKGCDLVIGDVTLDYAVRVLLEVTR